MSKERFDSGMYSGEEWSCRYFDGEWCEHLLLQKAQLTRCRGVYYSCRKQEIKNALFVKEEKE